MPEVAAVGVFQMSFAAECGWSLFRAVGAALLAVPLSAAMAGFVSRLRGRGRTMAVVLCVAPLFAPELLIGYGYSSFSLSLLTSPVMNHALYFMLVVLKFAPAGLIIQLIAPPNPLSREALHCDQLLRLSRSARSRSNAVGFRGRLATAIPIFGVVFLLVFQEFEMASLMAVPSWTVHLFDSQAGGVAIDVMAHRAVVPVCLQLAILIPLMRSVWRSSSQPSVRRRNVDTLPQSFHRIGGVNAGIGVALVWCLPFGLVMLSAARGASGFLQNTIMLQSFASELATAVVLAACSAVLSAAIAGLLLNRVDAAQRDSLRLSTPSIIAIAVCLPGLCGILTVSISVLTVIQLPALTPLRSTVLPVAIAMILFLIPRAILLVSLMSKLAWSEEQLLAHSLAASSDSRSLTGTRLLWHSGPRRTLWSFSLLAYWGLLNLTATAILCPASVSLFGFGAGVVPLPVRLYNLMHYGRTGPLSLMAVLCVLVPAVLMLLIHTCAPHVWRRLPISRSHAPTMSRAD